MNCKVCYRFPQENVRFITLECSCVHCDECLRSWIISQVQELEYQVKQELICMESFCKKPFKAEEVLGQFSKAHQDEISEVLLNSYLRKTQDIRQCPIRLCNYAGVIDLSSQCTSDFECLKCGIQWKEKIQSSQPFGIFESGRKLNIDGSELSSILWEEFFTKTCPRCNANIQKNGGCSHMNCKGCGMDFCWYCTQENYSHNSAICWINLAVKMALVVGFFVHIISLSGIFNQLANITLKVFNGVLEAFFLDFFLYLLCMFSPNNLIGRLYAPENQIRALVSLVIFTGFLLLVYLFDAFYSLLRMFIFQVGVVGLGLVYVDCFGKWVNNTY